jgi:hypothetical protein
VGTYGYFDQGLTGEDKVPIGAVKPPMSPFRSMVLDSSLHFLAYESPRAIQSFSMGVSYIAFMFLNVISNGYDFNWGPC